MENKWSPERDVKRRNEGVRGGRRGEAHNAMGHGGWTDSICSQLCVALVMDGELERPGECGNEGDTGDSWGGRRGR